MDKNRHEQKTDSPIDGGGLASQMQIQHIGSSGDGEVSIAKSAAAEAVASAQSAAKSAEDAAAALAIVQSHSTDISNAATLALAAKTKIVDEQAVIATKSEHIQKAQEHADSVRANLDRALTSATQQATEAEGLKTRAQAASESISALASDIRTIKSNVDVDLAATKAARETAEGAADTTKSLAERSATIDSRLADYETKLSGLSDRCDEQLKTIESLLPGAASAGLATAFDTRRQTFIKPQERWQRIFVGSLIVGTIIAGTGFFHAYWNGVTPSYDELARLLLCRAPVIAFLVWLALHSSREAALAKRLEEDYGYKSAVAASFVGFNKHMAEIGQSTEQNPPLARLCADTLSTVATPPGRIYERHGLITSPTDELSKAIGTLIDLIKTTKLPLE